MWQHEIKIDSIYFLNKVTDLSVFYNNSDSNSDTTRIPEMLGHFFLFE